MRTKTIFLIIAAALVAAFVALNVEEFIRPSILSLGFVTIQVSLGLVMLVLLAIVTLIFLVSTLYTQRSNLIETQHYARDLTTSRQLADKAEASRFTELRNYLEAQTVAAQQREAAAGTAMADRFARQQQALLARIEQSDNAMAAYIGQLEDRLERRGNTIEQPEPGQRLVR